MRLEVLLALLLCSSLEGQENSLTINSVHMVILPELVVQNGENLTLQCTVDISTNLQVQPQHRMLFYKDDVLFHNVTTTQSTESFPIPQARVHDAGMYKCRVILDNKKERATSEYQVRVKGVPKPRVTLDKKEAREGGVVLVNCSVPEERPPIHFTIEKFELDTKDAKLKREKTSHNQNFVTLEFPVEEQDKVISFHCQASIVSGTHVETSETSTSDHVTVTASFSTPKFHVYPEGRIVEGDQLYIRCTIQVTHLTQAYPEIIIQKDKIIVANNRYSNEAVYSVMALMEHHGNYTCKVEASRISKTSSVLVNITELFAKPQLESSALHLDQGEILSLWCSIPGAPAANFSIQKGDMVLSQTQNYTIVASEWDSGTYSCIAGIGKVFKKSNLVNITVCEMLSKPRIFHDSSAEVVKGQTIQISCQSTNGTASISYQLLKAGSFLQRQYKGSNEPAVFKDKPTSDTAYQCIADNCHSHAEMASEVLQVKVIAPVDKVKLSFLPSEEVESGKTIELQCSVNEASGPITYKFYRGEESKPFYQTFSNNTQAVWRKAEASKEQEGQYHCTAFNRANRATDPPRSNALTVRVFFAPWKTGLIAAVIIAVFVAILIFAAKCYVLRKAKAKQMPVEMSRPAVPLLNSSNEKVLSDPSAEANRHYGYDDAGNHAGKPINENKEPLTLDVEYTEVEVASSEPHRGLEAKGTETVYSEIRKTDPDFLENRYSRTEGSLDSV